MPFQKLMAEDIVMSGGDFLKSEYDWEVSEHSNSQSRKTVLYVLFDGGAQSQFSRVRITLLCSSDLTSKHDKAWQITPHPSSLSVASRVSSEFYDGPVKPNCCSLPGCDIVFVADRHSARSQTISDVGNLCGEVVFCEDRSQEGLGSTIFEVDQPLTENTQSVSVSFTSSRLLCTIMARGVFTDPSLDYSATVGRVIRILPVVATNEHKTIPLPTEVLLLIFENMRFPLTYRHWRKDVLSSALVCRQWACALDVLLLDFRSEHHQWGHPPEITSFAKEVVARPGIGRGIKHLSARYLEKHPFWDPFPSGNPSAVFPLIMWLHLSELRRAQFSKAFLSILHVTKNLQTLYLDSRLDLVVPPDDLASILLGLTKLEAIRGKCSLSMAQLASCVATWPSLKRLSIFGILTAVGHALPSNPPSCFLTEIEFTNVPIENEELVYLVSASGSSLERLTFEHISKLTNAGLRAALETVCSSLTYLRIRTGVLERDKGEEHALDAIVARMGRLTVLEIVPEVASERMVERRAQAFTHCTRPALREVHLCLLAGCGSPDEDLIVAIDRVWLGWQIRKEDDRSDSVAPAETP